MAALALPSRCRYRSAAAGFTYIGLMIMIAVIGLVSTASVQVGRIQQRRVAEQELLAIGMAFRTALVSYANATPYGRPTAPASLNDLVKDPRFPNPRRHLRKLYIDPLTGNTQWGLVRGPNGIIGVYSLAAGNPIKIGNFPPELADFTGKASYGDWKFLIPQRGAAVYLPRNVFAQ